MGPDEEDETPAPRGTPNAYFAGFYAGQEDTYGGAYRGVRPAPHGGAAAVRPDDTIGARDLCWCGRLVGHYWPGRDQGAPHPKEDQMVTAEPRVVNRRDLRAYHRTLQDFILLAQADGLKIRLNKNGCVVYPTDGTKAITVHARNTDVQIKQIHKWYAQHVFAPAVGEVAEEMEQAKPEEIAKLAAAKNDPIEHPTPAVPLPSQMAPNIPPRQFVQVTPPVNWVRYTTTDGKVLDHILISDKGEIKCTLCKDTDHESVASKYSISGHNRVYHSDTSTLHGPQARAKAVDTNRSNKLREQVVAAIELLAEVVDYQPASPPVDEAKVIHLEAMLKAANKRADVAEAKLKKLREALA